MRALGAHDLRRGDELHGARDLLRRLDAADPPPEDPFLAAGHRLGLALVHRSTMEARLDLAERPSSTIAPRRAGAGGADLLEEVGVR